MEHTKWYRDKVFYQIWPRSFRDGNGDGIGDLWGVYEKLDYLQQLGVDGVWFSLVGSEFLGVFVSLYFLLNKRKKYQY